MENNKVVDFIKDLIIVFFISVVLMTIAIKLSLVFIFFIPIPFIILSIRNNKFSGIIGIGIFSLLIGWFSDMRFAISMFLMFAPLIYVIQYLIVKKENINKSILISGIILLISILVILFFESRVTGINVKDQIEQSFNDVLSSQIEVFEDMDISKYKLDDLKDGLKNVYKVTLTLIPTLLIMSSLIIGYLNYKISVYIVNVIGYREYKVPDFTKLMLPKNFVFGSMIMFITTIIIGRMKLPYHNALTVNVGVLVSSLYLMQGIWVITNFLKRNGLGKVLRIFLVIILLSINILGTIIMILGFMDSIFDIRKIRGKTS